jgi:serine/threonine-protein kinase
MLIAGGRYQLLEELGAGGAATVHRAWDVTRRLSVALKLLPLRSDDVAERLRREARAAVALDHPGCVRVLDHGRCRGGTTGYLAMELLRGPTLRRVLDEGGPRPLATALATMAELLAALGHAHRRGVVHRDIKPENVMYGRLGDPARPILIDFGLAKLQDAPALTAAGFCFGSPSYLAPERLLGRPHLPAADVYAAGVLTYELVTGARPFLGDGPVAIARAALRGVAVPLRARAPGLSPVAAAFIDRAMAREPERRFPDADAMATALERVRRQIALDDDVTLLQLRPAAI